MTLASVLHGDLSFARNDNTLDARSKVVWISSGIWRQLSTVGVEGGAQLETTHSSLMHLARIGAEALFVDG
jgi:hypothetical protein